MKRKFRESHRGSEKEFQEKLKIIEELKKEAKLELENVIKNRIEQFEQF